MASGATETPQRIRIRMGDQAVSATLNNSEAGRDFAAMLPLTIQMDDHLRREKTGVIPRALSEKTQGSRTYELGDLGYWRPRNTFVIFYRQDGLTIPGPGIVRLGKVDSGVEIRPSRHGDGLGRTDQVIASAASLRGPRGHALADPCRLISILLRK